MCNNDPYQSYTNMPISRTYSLDGWNKGARTGMLLRSGVSVVGVVGGEFRRLDGVANYFMFAGRWPWGAIALCTVDP